MIDVGFMDAYQKCAIWVEEVSKGNLAGCLFGTPKAGGWSWSSTTIRSKGSHSFGLYHCVLGQFLMRLMLWL